MHFSQLVAQTETKQFVFYTNYCMPVRWFTILCPPFLGMNHVNADLLCISFEGCGAQ